MSDEEHKLEALHSVITWCDEKIRAQLEHPELPGYNDLLIKYTIMAQSKFDRHDLMVRRHRGERRTLTEKIRRLEESLEEDQASLPDKPKSNLLKSSIRRTKRNLETAREQLRALTE